MKGPATELIHAGEVDRIAAVPLTTPIYETTTFVFDNAEEVRAYNEGRSSKYLYSRYTNPTVVSVEQKLAAIDHAEAALTFSSGMGATATILMAHLKAGDEVICGAAIYGGTLHLLHDLLAHFGVTPRFVSLDDLANLERVISSKTRLVWFESPINPTLRCVDIRRVAEACRARRAVGDRQHLRQPDEPAAAGARRRSGDAERDEIPERPQRRDRRHGQRTEGAGRADREGAPAARHGDGPAPGVRARPRPEDAAVARRAPQRQRQGGRRVPRRRSPREPRLLPRAGVASRPRDREAADARLRRHGLLRSRRQLRPRRPVLRPAADRQARGQPRRHREPGQHAGADVAVGTHRRTAGSGGRDEGDAAAVGRTGRRRRPDRGSRSGIRS